MDFNLNDEQELFVAGIRELMASENWEAYFAECDRDSVYPERFVKALADMGIDSLLIPEEHGGLEAGLLPSPPSGWSWDVLARQLTCCTNCREVLTLSCVKELRSKLIKSWRSGAPVSRCGTLLSPNRERDRMLVV